MIKKVNKAYLVSDRLLAILSGVGRSAAIGVFGAVLLTTTASAEPRITPNTSLVDAPGPWIVCDTQDQIVDIINAHDVAGTFKAYFDMPDADSAHTCIMYRTVTTLVTEVHKVVTRAFGAHTYDFYALRVTNSNSDAWILYGEEVLGTNS